MENKSHLCYKVVKQIALVSLWFSIGLGWQIIGPSLPDLKFKLGIDYEEISRTLAAQSFGFFVGTAISGFLFARFYKIKDLMMAMGVFLGALGIALVPWTWSISTLGTALFMTGFSSGTLNSGGNTMVLHLWGDKAAPPMHSLHFGFGIGSIISPLIVRPYLSNRNEDRSNNTLILGQNISVNHMGIQTPNNTDSDYSGNLVIPYTICAAVVLAVSVIFLIFHIVGPPNDFQEKNPSTLAKDLFSPKTCSYGNCGYGVGLLVLGFFYFFQICGGEHSFGRFIFSYAIESDGQFSRDDAALLNTVFWICFAVGRGTAVPISSFLTPRIMIIIQTTGIILSALFLSAFSYSTPIALWVLTCCLGLLIAPVFPGGMAWINLRMEANSMAIMVFVVGASLGSMFYVYFSGYLFEYHGPRTLMYTQFVCYLIFAVVYGLMELLARCFRKLIQNGKVKQTEVYDEMKGNDTKNGSLKETTKDKVSAM